MYPYQAFGLKICSEIEMPRLLWPAGVEADAIMPDVTIRFGKVDHPRLNSGTLQDSCYNTPEGVLCFWRDVGAYWMRDGNEIVVDPLPGATEELIRLILMGPVFAMLLHLRGFLVLHASAVACEDGAVVFVGAKGHGKSTMAASIYARGHQLLADDVTAVLEEKTGEEGRTEDQPHLSVVPGFPMFKLWPEAAASALGDTPGNLPRLVEGYEKRARPISTRFATTAFPLRRLYVLVNGPKTKIRRLSQQDALFHVMSHSYIARYGKEFLHGKELVRHLQQCTSIVQNVPVYTLERPVSLSLLPEIAQMVERQLTSN